MNNINKIFLNVKPRGQSSTQNVSSTFKNYECWHFKHLLYFSSKIKQESLLYFLRQDNFYFFE